MAAFYRYYSSKSSQVISINANQENNNVEAANAAPAEEDLIADIQDGAALAVEIQLQVAEGLVQDVQGEVAALMGMQLERILCKEPHLRTPLEWLALNRWAEHQA